MNDDELENDINAITVNIADTNIASRDCAGPSGLSKRKSRSSTPATPNWNEGMAKRNELIERALSSLDEMPHHVMPTDDIQVFANYVATRMRKLKKPDVAERKINVVLLQCIDEEEAASTEPPPAKDIHIIENLQFSILGEDNQPFDGRLHKSFKILDEHGREVEESIQTGVATIYNLPQQIVANNDTPLQLSSEEASIASSSNNRRLTRANNLFESILFRLKIIIYVFFIPQTECTLNFLKLPRQFSNV